MAGVAISRDTATDVISQPKEFRVHPCGCKTATETVPAVEVHGVPLGLGAPSADGLLAAEACAPLAGSQHQLGSPRLGCAHGPPSTGSFNHLMGLPDTGSPGHMFN